ncbi:GNAT family N-acetyltransferase [Burkholderia gladioli]|uniref:GNAT family N-acetyltransferase n=1 Tax=Burkholderia gladioli TaxID=28095 RepID=UPI0010573D10|nr:GNAT family N-acetyltransferase [Burkholderia gladioli]MBU9324879.1 GNAT family N-acetyltransferase [Burkholderia gladioli]MDN7715935.1 GNAT family N-acetyltransferase [Burkholderia gladioli]
MSRSAPKGNKIDGGTFSPGYLEGDAMNQLQTRHAELSDIPSIEALIEYSVTELMMREYSDEQRRLSIGALFGVDRKLIEDRTYFVVESDGVIAGCGGWSFRRKAFGGEAVANREAGCLDPATEAAHIRAFYVHPQFARLGIATLLMKTSETAARERGFTRLQLTATLTGQHFYAKYGFQARERLDFLLPGDVRFPLVEMEFVCAEAERGGEPA